MLAGLLAGYSFDKKKSDMVWVGIFTYLIIFSGFYVNFPYDSSWAFVAFIEVLAGHGLYKMGFGDFLVELFSSPELKEKVDKVVTESETIKGAYKVNKDDYDVSQAYVVESEEVRHKANVCTKRLSNKGYAVLKTHKGYTVYVKPIIMDVVKDRVSNVDELCRLAENYNQIDY